MSVVDAIARMDEIRTQIDTLRGTASTAAGGAASRKPARAAGTSSAFSSTAQTTRPCAVWAAHSGIAANPSTAPASAADPAAATK